MVEVIVPSRFDQLVNNDGTPTTLFSAYLESLTDNNNDNIDIVEPYYRSLAALAALRAEVEDLKIIHSVNLIPVDDTLTKRIDDLQEELIGFVMGLINQKDLTGFLRNVVEDATPQLGGNLDTQSFTVDGRDVGTDGTKLDGIESGATADQTDPEIKTAYENNADTNAFTDNDVTTLGTALQNIVEDTIPQLGGELDAQNNNIINVNLLRIDNTTDSTTGITGSIQTDGGIGAVKNIVAGATIIASKGNIGNGTIRSDFSINKQLQVSSNTANERAGILLTVVGGGTNLRSGYYVDDNVNTVVFDVLWSSGNPNFAWQFNSVDKMTLTNTGNLVTIGTIKVNNTTSTINSGSGTPEGAVTATIGSTFSRTNGGAGTSFYVKESGTGNTGWIAK